MVALLGFEWRSIIHSPSWQLAHEILPSSPTAPSPPFEPSSPTKSGPEYAFSKKNLWPSSAAFGSSAYLFVVSGGGRSGSGERVCIVAHSSAVYTLSTR